MEDLFLKADPNWLKITRKKAAELAELARHAPVTEDVVDPSLVVARLAAIANYRHPKNKGDRLAESRRHRDIRRRNRANTEEEN